MLDVLPSIMKNPVESFFWLDECEEVGEEGFEAEDDSPRWPEVEFARN